MSEQSFILGAENNLIATLTPAEPTDTTAPRLVAVLTNAGVIPRSGPHRMNVHLARRFAKMGIPSVRFDLSGVGDSRRSGGALPIMQQWVVDTRAAMDKAQSSFGCDRFFMVGFCSGAEVAHLVALEDARMRAAVLWDLYAYPTLEFKLRRVMYRLHRAGAQGVVRKLLNLCVRALSRSPVDAGNGPAEVSQVPPRDEVARRFQTLVGDGVELLVAYSGGQNEWFNHREQFQVMFAGCPFVNEVAFEFLQISDHVITRREAQLAFTNMVVRWLEDRVLPAIQPAR